METKNERVKVWARELSKTLCCSAMSSVVHMLKECVFFFVFIIECLCLLCLFGCLLLLTCNSVVNLHESTRIVCSEHFFDDFWYVVYGFVYYSHVVRQGNNSINKMKMYTEIRRNRERMQKKEPKHWSGVEVKTSSRSRCDIYRKMCLIRCVCHCYLHSTPSHLVTHRHTFKINTLWAHLPQVFAMFFWIWKKEKKTQNSVMLNH